MSAALTAEPDDTVMGKEPKPMSVEHNDGGQPRREPELTDDVVAQARAGDHDAFARIVRAYDGRLRSLAYRLLEDATAMDDVLQDAYVKAYRALPRFDGRSAVGTWLYRIVYNTCLDALRARGRRPQTALDDVLQSAEPSDDPLRTIAERLDLEAALAALPTEHRAVVMLVDADGLSYAEAAEVLGVAAGTVGSRLNRAHAALRRALDEDGR